MSLDDAALNLRDLDQPATRAALAPFGIPVDVARRIFARVQGDGWTDVTGVRGLGKAAAAAVARATVWPDIAVVERRQADDGFLKYLFRLHDGHQVEAVRIPLPDPEDARALRARRQAGAAAGLEALPTAKYTLCLSSQAGCALACGFCATGRLGGIRNLETWEILAQHRIIAAEADHPVRGCVFMGMGEPFLNYANVMRAAAVLSDPAGPAIPARAISISTAGVVPAIRRFTADGHRYRLIVSLGAPSSDERRLVMPIEDRWPLADLLAALHDHAATTTQRIMIAYVAIGRGSPDLPGGNTSVAHAQRLAALLAGLKVRVSLIDVTDAAGRYQPPSESESLAFREALAGLGAPVVRRYSGGKDIGAACGMLSASRRGGAPVVPAVTIRQPAESRRLGRDPIRRARP